MNKKEHITVNRERGHQSFLYYVAQDLIGRYGNNLSHVTIVFPGKRAELYMNSFLSHIAQGPVWAPRFTTIDELFQQFSELTPCDSILSVCRLYRIYASLVPSPQSLDDFYGWGEILMNDFADIDKHMVDTERLFANGADLAALDQVDFLSDTQLETLRHFFANFDPEHQTDLKRRFLEMWQAMPEMYRRLKEELRREGIMYKGALYREVAEKMKEGGEERGEDHMYCFVGFNVLDEVEETLFSYLRDMGHALFYWDYDVYYASPDSDHEAGLFLRHNLQHYPCALPDDIYDNLSAPGKHIRLLSATTDNAQVRYLPQWMAEQEGRKDNHSAIILCDEALMRPAMHALPDTEQVNITMGFPLTDTAIHGYFSALFDLQVEGYDPELQRFRPTALERVTKNPFFTSFPAEHLPLQHQTDNLSLIDWLISAMESLGKQLAQSQTPTPYNQLYAEATFQLYRALGQFRWLVTDGTLNVKTTTLRRLVRQALATASIPFHGDMDEGLQVMGLLEARNLDFRHLVMLSVGEGVLPRRTSDTSLIPYILRAHFGLDTTERQDAVYAYSFYRLLQRADDITLVYNDNSSGATQREQSRFLRQMLCETDLPIEIGTIAPPSTFTTTRPITVEKDDAVMRILLAKKSLSPTAINQYIDCPLRFYYQEVAYLRMPDRPQDGIDPPRFGTIFHDTCELFYTHLCYMTGRNDIRPEDLAPVTSHPATNLRPYLGLAFWVDFFHAHEYDSQEHPLERVAFLAPYLHAKSHDEFRQCVEQLYAEGADHYFIGINMIIRDVILQLVLQLLRWDQEHAPFTLYEMESDHFTEITIPVGSKEVTLKIGGRIDRMDIMDIDGRPTLRVVDYKTGRAKSSPSSIEAIFDGGGANAHAYYLQTFLYSLIMSRQQSLPVAPCLFYVLSATDTRQYNPTLKLGRDNLVTDIRDVSEEYQEGLHRIIAEIYDPVRPFTQTADRQMHCSYCDFRRLCGR